MTRQFLRRCTLSLTGPSPISIPGGGPTDLTIEAAIGASVLMSPNPARFRIYNPNQQVISGFQNKEYNTITWEAGYEGGSGMVYSGNVKQSIIARSENVVDSYVDIFAGEHANGYQMAHVNKTLATGWTARDKVNLALEQMKPHGITGLGLVNIDLDSVKRPRGRAIVGMARDILREVAGSAGATWHMHRGHVHIIDPNKPIQSDGPVVLNSQTGLIGFVQQTENGIVARCLINPAIYVNTQVKIDESSIIQAERNNTQTGESSTNVFNLNNTGKIAADGIYRVAYLEVEASTRSQPWYMTLTCLATGANLNQGQIDSHLGIADGFTG